ncbi:MAG: VirB8/TrbF family protein [Rickettsiales bacterium]|nr:VirB8/TrbF family protein [Rickettsiales bacterium]
MSRYPEILPEESAEIANKIRSGEYFREAMSMYDLMVHDHMAERYFYIVITALSCLVLAISLVAMQSFYPLQRSVPFPYYVQDIVDDYPTMRPLKYYGDEKSDTATMRFLVENYITARETYDIEHFERYVNTVKQHSADEVFKQFQQEVDPRNPDSPITLYQRHSKRSVNILKFFIISAPEEGDENKDYVAEVTYEATVESKNDIRRSRYVATVSYNFSGIQHVEQLDEENSRFTFNFQVTRYQTKRS